MTRQRSWWPFWVGLALVAALGVLILLRAKAPPEAARLLPESDAMVYVNLRPLRALTRWGEPDAGVPPPRGKELENFVQATGIDPERDLDSAAFALHRMSDPRGPNGAVAYSEVFIGHFDEDRLRKYLSGLARGRESYAGHDIYLIPVENRTLRVTQLSYDTVAASNMPTPEQIHSMLDRANAAALWRPGSSLLAARFHQVPLLSLAWGIGRIGLPFGQDGRLSVMGFELPLPVDTEMVASLRYGGSLHLRVEEFAPDALAAQHTTDTVNNVLGIVRGVASANQVHTPREAAMRDVLSSIATSQHGNRAVLTAGATVQDARALVSADALVTEPQVSYTPEVNFPQFGEPK